MDLNRVTLIGNLTGDPELKKPAAGRSVARFTLATNGRWDDSGKAPQDSVEFHEVVAFGKLAEIIGVYVKQGSKVYVEGHLRARSTTGKDGTTRNHTEIMADNLIMLGHRRKREIRLVPKEDQ